MAGGERRGCRVDCVPRARRCQQRASHVLSLGFVLLLVPASLPDTPELCSPRALGVRARGQHTTPDNLWGILPKRGQTAGEGEGAGIGDDGRRAVRRAGVCQAQRLRGGQEAADYLKDEVFGAWDPQDSEDEAELERFWGRNDPYSDPRYLQELKERFDNLTAYGEALGVLESECPKEEWEPQDSEEDATMRHGSRPWTPAEIIADFERHGADDQDSSYDKEDRAVPEVSPEEFLRDPEATWRKFRREAERPGHISSHRSAYRRLPQYLKPLEVEKHMAMRRYLERSKRRSIDNSSSITKTPTERLLMR